MRQVPHRAMLSFQEGDDKGIVRSFEKLLEVGTVTRGCPKANALFSSTVDDRPPGQLEEARQPHLTI